MLKCGVMCRVYVVVSVYSKDRLGIFWTVIRFGSSLLGLTRLL